jgi:hypothetical protein
LMERGIQRRSPADLACGKRKGQFQRSLITRRAPLSLSELSQPLSV